MKKLIVLGVTVIALSACSYMPTWMPGSGSSYRGVTSAEAARIEKQIRERADYWQRADYVSATYMTGPKAQHQLNTDLASCVAEVRELVRLGSIRSAKPPEGIGMSPGMKQGWNSVTRNGPLFMEYTPFQDFDGCMMSKGWERVDFVRPVVSTGASQNYNATIFGTAVGMPAESGSSGAYRDPGTNGFNN